jgi:hypothetical protein
VTCASAVENATRNTSVTSIAINVFFIFFISF